MDFTKIRLIGLSTVTLPIIGALPSDTFILKAADGLGPPESDVSISNSLETGGVYLGRRTHSREIVLRVGLNANFKLGQTPNSLRTILYGLLTPAETEAVKVQFLNGESIVAVTTGYVSKIEIVPFSKDPEVQIVIPCPETYLRDDVSTTVIPSTKNPFVIPNTGTAPTGFNMEITFTQAQDTWFLTGPQNWKMNFEYQFNAFDVLRFNTRPGYRSIERVRNGVVANLIYTLSPGSKWLILRGGANEFTPLRGSFNWGFVNYTPKYWGI